MQHPQSPRPATRPALLALVIVAAGCAHAPNAPAVRAPAAPPARASATPAAVAEALVEAHAQVRAQRVWCTYLDTLYRRASHDGSPWPHRDECLANTSNASPEMLERTATCSRRALDGFTGDPLTPEYAALVHRCGADALDSVALALGELDPFLEIVCRRAETCDATPYDECRAALAPRVMTRLGRAIGAINQGNRARLRTCLRTVGCEVRIGDRLSGCIEPIMDKLLWLPGGHAE